MSSPKVTIIVNGDPHEVYEGWVATFEALARLANLPMSADTITVRWRGGAPVHWRTGVLKRSDSWTTRGGETFTVLNAGAIADPLTVRCTYCRGEFTDEQIAGAKACPKCGTHGVPMAIGHDLEVRINWHELRLLVIWAENWESRVCADDSGHRPGVIAAIAKALERYRPEGAPPLRLFDEIRDLQSEYPSAELRDETGHVLLPGKKVQ